MIRLKRAYEAAASEDGVRILVDRLWPRGVQRSTLRLDAWLKDLGPSDALRRWFGHDSRKWTVFRRRYAKELGAVPDAISQLRAAARRGTVTLVYGARDREHNNAAALREYLTRRRRAPRAAKR